MTATTYSDAFPAADIGSGPAVEAERARVDAHARARIPATERDGKISRLRGFVGTVWSDIRSAWWAPASLPTVRQAWTQRVPDRTRVPGDNGLLYGGWWVYNHFAALPLITVITGVVGALGVAGWVLLNPARIGLAIVIAAPIAALILFG